MKKVSYNLKTLDPYNSSFLIGLPLIGFLLLWAHIHYEGFNPWLIVPAFLMYALTVFSISAGYHRLFAHRAFKANTFMKLFFLIFGAASGESTALKWASDHRIHHQKEDTDEDPYNIHQGFFYAHMGWVMLKASVSNQQNFPKDLTQDKWLMWQHKHAVSLAIISNIIICLVVGYLSGDYLGSIAIVGLLRLTFVHHITFCINSFCHMFGTRPYDDNQTARDSTILGILTFGEGYHNFHHAFQNDYRNGHLWYQWDPTKWIISVTTKFGWTWDLKRVSESAVLKARMNVQERKFQNKAPRFSATKIHELKERVQAAQKRWIDLKAEYARMNAEFKDQGSQKVEEIKLRIKEAKEEFNRAYKEWLDNISLKPAMA